MEAQPVGAFVIGEGRAGLKPVAAGSVPDYLMIDADILNAIAKAPDAQNIQENKGGAVEDHEIDEESCISILFAE